MEEKVLLAALAGLLHDVGKFAVRAGVGSTRTWDNEAKKDYKYFHALLTADFIDKYVPDPWRIPVKNCAANHHRPIQREDCILALADHLSAGERADPGEDQRAVQPRQLLSIFCSITADGQKTPKDAYYPLTALMLQEDANSKSIFPGDAWDDNKTWKAYESLWDEFCQGATQLRDAHVSSGDLKVYIESLQLLMQRYTWCMPSAYYHSRPDISLYDHDRMTGALATLLTDSSLSDEELRNMDVKPEEGEKELALLVGGDISGVQDFIYTITARGATSALRGRSFYVQVLTEAIARYVLNQLGLPVTNLIYTGGGNFYILARVSDSQRLLEIQKVISQILLNHHRGDLYVALASLPLKTKDFFGGVISGCWGNLTERIQRSKQRKFSELGTDLSKLFRPQGHGGNQDKQCQVCGNEHPQTKADPHTDTPENEEEVRKCPACFSYEALGEDLRNAEYLIMEEIPSNDTPRIDIEPEPGDWLEVLKCFGYEIQLCAEAAELHFNNTYPRLILGLSEKAYQLLIPIQNDHTAIGRRFLVNVTPTISEREIQRLRADGVVDLPAPGSTKPFHAMEAQSDGIHRLGVLRMDVDNTGELFAKGLGKQASLSRVATLSFTMNLFFEGWVEVLAEQQNKISRELEQGERLYSIYSGGDDLFFVGSWDIIIELARLIRSDLTSFVANHPGIHTSAGIVLVEKKYPLYQSAEDSLHSLEKAKHLQWIDGETPKKKDAIDFLGQTLGWSKFGLADCSQRDIYTAHALMHLLVAEKDSGSTPLIRRLIGLHERYQEALDERRKKGIDQNQIGKAQTLWGPWNWLGYYSLSRLYRQRKDENIRDLRDQLKADDFRSIEWIGLAARWAELRLRNK